MNSWFSIKFRSYLRISLTNSSQIFSEEIVLRECIVCSASTELEIASNFINLCIFRLSSPISFSPNSMH